MGGGSRSWETRGGQGGVCGCVGAGGGYSLIPVGDRGIGG